MPVNPNAVGAKGDPRRASWTSDQCLLYALWVGAGVTDPVARRYAAWRRGVLWVAAVPCAFAALFGLITQLAADKDTTAIYSSFGMLLMYRKRPVALSITHNFRSPPIVLPA